MRAIRANSLEKVLALLFALFMWASARTQQRPVSGGWEAKLQQRGKPADLAVVKGPSAVRFSAVANRQELRRLEETAEAIVDLSDAKPGRGSFDIYYQLTGGISVERIELRPARAEFVFERVVENELAVEVEVTGSPPEGFDLSEPTPSPSSVSVKGRTGLLSQVKRAVAVVDMSDPSAPLQTALVRLLGETGKEVAGLRPTPRKVEVRLSFQEQEESIEVPILNHLTARAAPGLKVEGITLDPDSLKVTGRVDLLRQVRWIDTESVTLSGVSETTNRRLALKIPPGLSAAAQTTVATILVKPLVAEGGGKAPATGGGKAKGKAKTDAKSAGKGARPETGNPTDGAEPAGAEASPSRDSE